MKTLVIGLGAVALVMLGSGSSGAECAATQAESVGIQVAEAPKDPAPAAKKASKPMDPSASGIVGEGKSAKKELKDDSADNKKRAKKGAGKAGSDIKRTFKDVFKKK